MHLFKKKIHISPSLSNKILNTKNTFINNHRSDWCWIKLILYRVYFLFSFTNIFKLKMHRKKIIQKTNIKFLSNVVIIVWLKRFLSNDWYYCREGQNQKCLETFKRLDGFYWNLAWAYQRNLATILITWIVINHSMFEAIFSKLW